LSSSHTQLVYHLVFSTKDRRPLITPKLQAELYPYFGGIIKDQRGKLLDVGGVEDHVHIVASLHPTTSVAEMIRLLKSNSSKWIRERRDFGRWLGWQTGYGAFSVSTSQVAAVRRYVVSQRPHHRKLDYKHEYLLLLKKHGIDYNERYLWE